MIRTLLFDDTHITSLLDTHIDSHFNRNITIELNTKIIQIVHRDY
jgi:hypothetical protein